MQLLYITLRTHGAPHVPALAKMRCRMVHTCKRLHRNNSKQHSPHSQTDENT